MNECAVNVTQMFEMFSIVMQSFFFRCDRVCVEVEHILQGRRKIAE